MNLGQVFPDFSADSTQGKIESFHKYLGEGWGILFSHPADYTPVCTTELLRVARLEKEFTKRHCKVAAVSCDEVESHKGWIKDILSVGEYPSTTLDLPYPIIADPKRELAVKLGMLDPVAKDAAGMPQTCRAVFIIGPDKLLKLSILYPASTGRNFHEIIRVLDSLQLTANFKCATPADWSEGKECMVLPSVPDDVAKKTFAKGFKQLSVPSGKGYLRLTPDPRFAVAPGTIMGFGNPLLDISSHVPEEFLKKYDVKLNNAILAEDKHKSIYDEMIKSFEVDYVAGGATQNSIRVAQWMLQSPGSTKFVGSIGKNCQYGARLKEVAEMDGLTTIYYESDKNSTGTCAVLVNAGERSLVANLAAANDYSHKHTLSKEVQDAIHHAKIFYSSSFFLTPPEGLDSMLHVAQHAADAHKIYCLNLAAPFLIDFFYDKMSQVLPFADFVFGNESEAQTFAKKHGWDEKNLELVAEKLSKMEKKNHTRSRTVVFTQGADPTIVYHEGKVTLFKVPKLEKELIQDTNGAGDAFVGGFLAKLAQGKPIAECVAAGQYASREVIQRSGCTFPPFPKFEA